MLLFLVLSFLMAGSMVTTHAASKKQEQETMLEKDLAAQRSSITRRSKKKKRAKKTYSGVLQRQSVVTNPARDAAIKPEVEGQEVHDAQPLGVIKSLEAIFGLQFDLMTAINNDADKAILQKLIAAGAEPDSLLSNWGELEYASALHYAAAHGKLRSLAALAELGYSVDAVRDMRENKHGYKPSGSQLGTPLVAAAEKGQDAAIEWLLAHGADVNGKGDYGVGIPLVLAAGENNPSSVKILLQAGADINLAKPLTLGHKETIGFLKNFSEYSPAVRKVYQEFKKEREEAMYGKSTNFIPEELRSLTSDYI